MAVETVTPQKKSTLQALTEAALKASHVHDDDLDFDLDYDPTAPSLEKTASAGHPFSLCWSREVRSILSGLDTSRLKDPTGPWVLNTPFDLQKASLSIVLADAVKDSSNGLSTTGHYRDGFSTTSESSYEHLSAALGITVGYPFLNASVSAKYDKQVTEDKNGVKASRNASCRAGRVVLDRTPVLSEEALKVLQSGPGGEERFRKRYGDFYIAGFVLGADAGACMSASTESRSSKETLEITVKVKVLFFSASYTHTEVTEEHSSSSSISFSGYSTLDNVQPCALTLSGNSQGNELRVLQMRAKEYLNKVAGLQKHVETVMKDVGLVDGGTLKLGDCMRLCRSGLVVELLLAPFARLNQYVQGVGLRYVGTV
ncbi:hypothetical protein QBC43DRAFT_283407 [Cladorrhinum sp. PSN259]|nr:hypothetical protein QBC43DRAFT_283407 [Cladorrhinum sp. PSN259]